MICSWTTQQQQKQSDELPSCSFAGSQCKKSWYRFPENLQVQVTTAKLLIVSKTTTLENWTTNGSAKNAASTLPSSIILVKSLTHTLNLESSLYLVGRMCNSYVQRHLITMTETPHTAVPVPGRRRQMTEPRHSPKQHSVGELNFRCT